MYTMKKRLTQTDHRNILSVKLFCRNVMHCSYKRLPRGWGKFSDNPKTPCARIMEKIVTPPGTSRAYY